MPETAEISIEKEVARWKIELEAMKEKGNRVAKAKLKELEAISHWDLAGLQNWTTSLFLLSRRNELMAEAQTKVRKEKPETVVVEAPRRKEFKTLEALLAHYKDLKAIRKDGRVPSSSLEVYWKGDDEKGELWMKVTPPTKAQVEAGEKHTVPEGEFQMLSTGIVTFCRRLGMSYTYFMKYPKKDEIAEHMNVLNRSLEKDYVLRLLESNGTFLVQAVVAKGFIPIDHSDILEAVLDSAKEAGGEVKLESFFEGPFDRATDVIDLRLPGSLAESGHPVLRIVNSEVDMSPLLFSAGVWKGTAPFVSMVRKRGAVRLTHRGKSGDIKDWLKVPELVKKSDTVAADLQKVWDNPLHRDKTTEFLVHKVGLVASDVEAHLQDWFTVHPGPETMGNYVHALVEVAKHQLSVTKMTKLGDLALALAYGDIPIVV